MSRCLQQIRDCLSVVRVTGPDRFLWFGEPSIRLRREVRGALSADATREVLAYSLQLQLYNDFYLQGMPRRRQHVGACAVPWHGPETLRACLASANTGRGFLDVGWRVTSIQDDVLSVTREGITASASLEQCDGLDARSARPGDWVKLKHPNDLRGVSPGFYMALGDVPLDRVPTVRLYWNVLPQGAVILIECLTRALNAVSVPFRLKALHDPEGYHRCDACVLYLPKAALGAVWQFLTEAYATACDHLAPESPALTFVVAPGLALAEDPSDGSSYGMSRCRLIAEALIEPSNDGSETDQRLAVVAARFESQGLSLTSAYLNAGSSDADYASLRVFAPARSASRGGSPPWIEIADAIARDIAAKAIWHAGRCTWLGVAQERTAEVSRPPWTTLRGDLYGGTAGVALLFSELARTTGSSSHRDVALGALGHAVEQARLVDPALREGAYTGSLGVAWAAALAGSRLGCDELWQASTDLVAWLFANEGADEETDLLSGDAGAILAALSLERLGAAQRWEDPLARWGDRLLARALRSRRGWGWASTAAPGRRPLTGLSHGAAGIGLALFELSARLGHARYGIGAREAFAYEHSWFCPEHGNWPDFRGPGGAQHRRLRSEWLTYATYWCHGAPGIGLARQRAWELTGDLEYAGEASTAAHTTRQWLREALRRPAENYSLCHGVAGAALVQRQLGRSAGDLDAARLPADLAEEAADDGWRRHGLRTLAWPCGTNGGETPGLMLGWSGVGYFYLSLHDPNVPDVLALREPPPRGERSAVPLFVSQDYL